MVLSCGKFHKNSKGGVHFHRKYLDNKDDQRYMNILEKCDGAPIFLESLQMSDPIQIRGIEKGDIREELVRLKRELKINYEFESHFQNMVNKVINKPKTFLQPLEKTYVTKFARTHARLLEKQTKFSLKLIKTMKGMLLLDLTQETDIFFPHLTYPDSKKFLSLIYSPAIAQFSNYTYYLSGGYHSKSHNSIEQFYKLTLKKEVALTQARAQGPAQAPPNYSLNFQKLAGFHGPRNSHCTIIANNILYIIGGEECVGSAKKVLETVEACNLATQKWSKLPPLAYPRKEFSAFLYREKIWVIGDSPYVESYGLATKSWKCEMRLPINVNHFGLLACYGNSVVVLGGCDSGAGSNKKDRISNKIWRVGLEDQSCKFVREMNMKRGTQAVYLFDRDVMVFGGNSTDYNFNLAKLRLAESEAVGLGSKSNFTIHYHPEGIAPGENRINTECNDKLLESLATVMPRSEFGKIGQSYIFPLLQIADN
jgi:hypothetical protein